MLHGKCSNKKVQGTEGLRGGSPNPDLHLCVSIRGTPEGFLEEVKS